MLVNSMATHAIRIAETTCPPPRSLSNPNVGIGDIGAGLEFRFRRHYGIFTEGRYIIGDYHKSYGLESAGFSYTF